MKYKVAGFITLCQPTYWVLAYSLKRETGDTSKDAEPEATTRLQLCYDRQKAQLSPSNRHFELINLNALRTITQNNSIVHQCQNVKCMLLQSCDA